MRSKSGSAGFSLIEVALAVGVIAFAFVPLLGLMPIGLDSFRNAGDTSLKSQISQRIVNELQQTDFSTLISGTGGSTAAFQEAVRYFDYQGDEILDSTKYGTSIYEVNTRITPATTLPKSGQSVPDNADLATATIQTADSPGGTAPPMDSTMPLLWSTSGPISVSTVSTIVARNK